MTDPALVAFSADIAAIQAEVAGMVAFNDYRKKMGLGSAYDAESFFQVAERLRGISDKIGKLYSR